MRFDELPTWLLSPIFGAEGGEQTAGGESGQGSGEEQGEQGEQGEGANGEQGEQGEQGEEEVKGDGALKALRTERAERKRLERELRAARRETERHQQEEADKKLAEESQVKAAEAKAQRAEDRVKSLAERFKQSSLDALIRDAARDQRFHDVQDALLRVDRSGIRIEQDPDDPTDLDIDESTVVAAVKAVAEKNKHLIKPEGPDEPSGGGGFHQSGDKDKDKSPVSRFRI